MANCRALERGITLAEVIMVVAIGMTLFAMAVPAAQNDDIAGVVARNLVSDAVRSRSHARRSWETVTMQVDTSGERWRTVKQDGSPLLESNSEGDGWHEVPPGVDLRAVENFPTDLTFLPNGRASESTAIQIVVGSKVWEIRIGALSARITASSLSGSANP